MAARHHDEQVSVEEGGGKAARTCSGKCGDVAVGPIPCPDGMSPVLDCTKSPPTLSCIPNDAPNPFRAENVDYKTLAVELLSALGRPAPGAARAASAVATGDARITGDDCSTMSFTCNGVRFSFTKEGKESWVETVKNSHRSRSLISVSYDRMLTRPDGSHTPVEVFDA
jgi:hypothetical protein